MYPARFEYEAPRSLGEAIGLLTEAGDEAKVLAGGQSLIPLMKLRFAAPRLVVDINNIGDLAYHHQDSDGTLRVGALCRHVDLERSTLLKDTQPLMASAAPVIADPIVRNRGTLVGSLCHADPQGDWASVVTALGGTIIAQGPAGRRAIPVREFVTGPFSNTLAPDEIAVAILAELVKLRASGELAPELSMSHRPGSMPVDVTSTDPVCGMTVTSDAYTAVRDGVTYRFCCVGCRHTFEESASRC
ncbi:MAG: FAD binding domain-containing protein [Streptosporangiaceae bacterium]|jgi:carbon-monoxide dehydrogenase medium subunit